MSATNFKVLSVYFVISMLNCGSLSVYYNNWHDTYPYKCELDGDCPLNQRCSDNLCVDACKGVECQLHERCITKSDHKGRCECCKSSQFNTSICIPPCYDDRDCEPSRECKPDADNFYQCVCRPGFDPDPVYPLYSCRYRCQTDADCFERSICKKGKCLDFCDSAKCPSDLHKICIIFENSFLCYSESMISKLYYE